VREQCERAVRRELTFVDGIRRRRQAHLLAIYGNVVVRK
jgi:hypothetical protein